MVRRAVLVLLFASLGVTGCPVPEPEPEPEPEPLEVIPPGTLSLTIAPLEVEPGEPTLARIAVSGDDEPHVELALDLWPARTVEMTRQDGGWSGTTELVVDELGDHLATATVDHADGPDVLYVLFAVTRLSPCPDGELREAGVCHPVEAGSSFEPGWYFNANVPGRSMTHPRGLWWNDEVALGCITDSVAMFGLAGLEELPQGSSPRQEVVVEDEAGLIYCDAFGFDEERRLGVTPSRGAMGFPGGLASWRFPELTAPVTEPPEHLFTLEVPSGAEGVVVRRDHVYVAEKPDQLAVYELADDGHMEELGRTALPSVIAAWGVGELGELVLVTDAGHRSDDEGAPDPSLAATLSVVDVSDPTDPVVIGSADSCVARAAVAIDDVTVALACGNSGIQTWSLAEPSAPELLAQVDTPGVVSSVAAADGYLFVADWEAFALYDVAEPDSPRLVQASNLSGFMPADTPEQFRRDTATNEAALAVFDGERYLAGDISFIRGGRILPGRRAPSLDVIDRRALVSSTEEPEIEIPVRFRNLGRAPVTVRTIEVDGLTVDTAPLTVPPFGRGELVVGFAGDGEPDEVSYALVSDDPFSPMRVGVVHDVGPGYAPGRPMPPFRVPALGLCDDDDCPPEELGCWDTDELPHGIPIVYAFFSSW
jgi:hypothetical protein